MTNDTIPEGKTLEDIKAWETIIRNFYRERKCITHEKVLYCITAITNK